MSALNPIASTKIVKYSRVQNPPFTAALNPRFDVVVPAGVGFSDVTQSALCMRVQIQNVSRTPGTYPNGELFPWTLGFVKTNAAAHGAQQIQMIGGPVALIRNCRVESDAWGVLSEQRFANVTHVNLDWYTKSRARESADGMFGNSLNKNYGSSWQTDMCESPFLLTGISDTNGAAATDASKVYANAQAVTTNAQNVQCLVRVPLSIIDRVGEGVEQYPNEALGNLTYHIELENIIPVCGVHSAIPQMAINDFTAQGGTIPVNNTLRVTQAYARTAELEQIPFYVGMPVTIRCQNNGTAHVSLPSRAFITSITSTAGAVDLIILDDAGNPIAFDVALTNGASTFVTIEMGVPYTAPTWTVLDAFIEVVQENLTPAALAQARAVLDKGLILPFYEYRTQVKPMSATNYYQDVVALDPGTVGVAVLTPASNELVSTLDACTSYQFTIDGLGTTDRAIPVGYNAATNAHATLNAPQMHNHRLQQWYANLGKRLAKFSAPWIDYSEDVATTRVLDCHMLYPQITPVSELPMNLQLSLVGGNMAAKNVFYVSAIGKKLIIKGGRIVGLETFTPKDVM